MAMIKCPECSAQVSDKASACPHCGYPILEMAQTAGAAGKPFAESVTAASPPAISPLEDSEVVPLELTMGKILRRHVLLTSESITVGRIVIPFETVVSLRWGTLVETMQVGFLNNAIATHRWIWVKTPTSRMKISCSEARVLLPDVYGCQWIHQKWIYEALKARLWWHCGVDLMLRFIERIFSGETVTIAGVDCTRDGPVLKRRLPRAQQRKGPSRPWRDLKMGVWNGELLVFDTTTCMSIKVLKTDNAPMLHGIVGLMHQLHDWFLEEGNGDLTRGVLKMLSTPNLNRSDWRVGFIEHFPDW